VNKTLVFPCHNKPDLLPEGSEILCDRFWCKFNCLNKWRCGKMYSSANWCKELQRLQKHSIEELRIDPIHASPSKGGRGSGRKFLLPTFPHRVKLDWCKMKRKICKQIYLQESQLRYPTMVYVRKSCIVCLATGRKNSISTPLSPLSYWVVWTFPTLDGRQ
jgi:hypothetical protein